MPANPRRPNQLFSAEKQGVKSKFFNYIGKFTFSIIMLLEFLSLTVQGYIDGDLYLYKVYPFMCNLILLTMFFYVFTKSERLRFCNYQRLILTSILAYYIINTVFCLVSIEWREYYNLMCVVFLVTIITLIIAKYGKDNQ